MKESRISKCVKKEWNVKSPVLQRAQPPSKMQSTSHSFLHMENGIHFVLDSNNYKYSSALPTEKNIELSRKTYSKKNPITYHPLLSPGRTDTFDGSNFAPKSTPNLASAISQSILKCPSNTSKTKCTVKRSKVSSEVSSTSTNGDSRKPLKKTIQFKRDITTIEKVKPRSKSLGESSKANGNSLTVRPHKSSLKSFDKKLAKPSKSKSLSSIVVDDEDSDIEVLEVKFFPSMPVNDVNSKSMAHARKPVNGINGKRRNGSENEGSSKKKCDSSLLSHSLISSHEILINEADTAPFMPSNPIEFPEAGSSSSSVQWLSVSNSVSHTEHNISSNGKNRQVQKSNVVAKPSLKKPKGRRELKSLFENLNEISWAHEASFKSMLTDSTGHTQRGKVKIAQTRKKLRKQVKLKSKSTHVRKKTSTVKVVALKKSRLAKMNQMRAKPIARNKIVPMMNKIRKQNIELEKKVLAEANKGKANVKPKAQVPKIATKKFVVIKPNVPNDKETKPDIAKLKSSFKLKMPDMKVKPGVSKEKSSVKKIKFENPEPSTSGLNATLCNKAMPSSSSKQLKAPKQPHYLKNFNGFEEHNSMQVVQSIGNKDIHSAVQKGSKLQVRLRPLEHTNFWTPNFYEDFRKNFLDQALHRAIESKDHDSIATMFQELLNSVLSPQTQATNDKGLKKKKCEEEALRSSVRQSEGAFRYKEIVVKKHPNYIQVVLVPNEVKQNCLSIEAMKEIRDAFLLAKKDPNCKAVLLNSSGRYFCSGIDLSQIVGSNRKQVIDEMTSTIQELVLTLCTFTKPLIAAVNGATYGFGVSLLTYCDVVLASDKATFCVPAIRLGYLPVGGITLTLPHVVGTVRANEILLQGRCLTAEEALRYGLVTELMWPTALMNNVIPRLQKIISQPLQAMEATKSMIRCHLWDKLKNHVERERRLLRELWLATHCQNNIKRLLQTGYLAD